jgi:hypothetical protein
LGKAALSHVAVKGQQGQNKSQSQQDIQSIPKQDFCLARYLIDMENMPNAKLGKHGILL